MPITIKNRGNGNINEGNLAQRDIPIPIKMIIIPIFVCFLILKILKKPI